MSEQTKMYAERDIEQLDELGDYYCRHVHAMTGEQLHSKSDIAAELAHRDYLIDQLRKPASVLMSAENPNGHKLEDLLHQLQCEVANKNAKLTQDNSEVAATVRANNRQIIVLLKNAEALQRESYRVLRSLGPDQGPTGKPRIGNNT